MLRTHNANANFSKEPDVRLTAMRRAGRLALLSTVCVSLMACSNPEQEISEMSVAMEELMADTDLQQSSEDPSPVQLEDGFFPALRAAVLGNAGYRAALNTEAETAARIGVAMSVRRPQITGNATAGGLRESGSGPDATTTGLASTINLSQLIYDGGETAAGIDQATAAAIGARAEREARGNDLALQAAKAWIDVWQFQGRLALLRTRTTEMDTLIGQLERMASNGMVDRAAMDSARRQIVDISLEEIRLLADLEDAQVRFARYYRIDPTELDAPPQLMTLDAMRALSTEWDQAPVLERSAAELLGARSAVTIAEAAFKPSVRVQAGVRSPLGENETTDTSIGVVLEYTFGDGGRRRAELEAAQTREAAARDQFFDAQQATEAEIQAALSRLSAIERSMPLVAEQVRLSASEASTSRSQITTGQSNLRQLVEAEIENYRAQDRRLAMQAERMVLMLSIAAQTGELTKRIGLDDTADVSHAETKD